MKSNFEYSGVKYQGWEMTVDSLLLTGISHEARMDIVNSFDWSQIRETRNQLIADTDWTQVPDCKLSSEKKVEFSLYRQALRDIPQSHITAVDVTWPEKPII